MKVQRIKISLYCVFRSHSSCNAITGAHDGFLFSKKVTKSDKLMVFRPAFCRKLAFYFSYAEELLNGVEVYWFTPNEFSLADNLENPDTSCYCDKLEKCYKRGVGNVSPCYHSGYYRVVKDL